MKTKIAILIMIILHFTGCTKPSNYGNSLVLAQKEPCLTCQVDLKRK